jgi:hypothetical protein
MVDVKLKRSLYLQHIQKIQHLEPGNLDRLLEYWHWLVAHPHLHQYILFTDEAQFNHDGVSSTTKHLWSDVNPYGTVEANF